MARRKNRRPYRALAFSLGLTLIMLAAGVYGIESLSWAKAAGRLIRPLLRLLGFILVGLAVGQIIEALGWTRALAMVARPVFRYGRLGHRCGAAFMAAFVSGVTANAMLVEFYRDDKITRPQLFLTNFINQFPAFFLHLPTTFFIVMPLTGRAGAFYFLLTFTAALLRTLLLLVYGHFRLPAPQDEGALPNPVQQPQSRSWQEVLTGLRRKLPRRMTMVAVWVMPIYVAVFLANTMGWFDFMQNALAHLVVSSFIPVESLSVVVLSFVAHVGRCADRQADGRGPARGQPPGLSHPGPAPSAAPLHGDFSAQDGHPAAGHGADPAGRQHHGRRCGLRPDRLIPC